MDCSKNLVIINGENKTSQVERISFEDNPWVYQIKFYHFDKVYTYTPYKVTWMTHPTLIKINNKIHHVYIYGRREYNINEISAFISEKRTYWHVLYKNGYTQDLMDEQLIIKQSCLIDKKSKNVFEYFKAVATTNILGKNEEHPNEGILSKIYERMEFIDGDTILNLYLNPQKTLNKKQVYKPLIFPFGCNKSQKKAVYQAFENRISIIQGPPGTGKTQTILNIIANIIQNNQSVLIVSNNNSAIENVHEKLAKKGFECIVASLGRKENKDLFITNQPNIPNEIESWCKSEEQIKDLYKEKEEVELKLNHIYLLQEQKAIAVQELKDVELEKEHFTQEIKTAKESPFREIHVSSSSLLTLWLQIQENFSTTEKNRNRILSNLTASVKWLWIAYMLKYRLKLKSKVNKSNIQNLISEIQILYYRKRTEELRENITTAEIELQKYDASKESERLTSISMQLFKAVLGNKYFGRKRLIYTSIDDIKEHSIEFIKDYPVVLSTTFSSRSCLLGENLYDYLIMDEASQVSIETGVLALSCAKNAVIIGDTLQLPNVVTEKERRLLNDIAHHFDVLDGYNCANKSFLQSVCEIIPDIEITLLKEHYRCHPKIIDFCNKKFYDGKLLIMTKDAGEENVISAIKTAPGNHSKEHYNQREIDVIKQEVLPFLSSQEDVGIIAPYKNQVEKIQQQIPNVESATVHKFQGREKNSIIFSVTDDQITSFSDDIHLLNVAISRAINQFRIVVSGNVQKINGNIRELISYIEYNNGVVTESKIHSIFDYLYSQYAVERKLFFQKHPRISEYDSENLTYVMILKLLKTHSDYKSLDVLCHIPLNRIFKDFGLMDENEKKYASNHRTHVDFLIYNRISKKPILAVETDGYSFHHNQTYQHQRDLMKDHIFILYEIPLIRLSTNGSGEEERIMDILNQNIY